MSKKILVAGAGGFIGGHLVKRLRSEGFWVRGVDLKRHDFSNRRRMSSRRGPPRSRRCPGRVAGIDEVYQLAADMGGAGYIFTGEHDAAVMHNSATINLNMLEFGARAGVKRFFYSSSACIYPEYNQLDPDNPKCSEDVRVPGGARQRIWVGEAVQRAPLSGLHAELWRPGPGRAVPQHFRS